MRGDRRTRAWIVLVLALSLAASGFARAAEAVADSGAVALIERTVEEVLAILNDPQLDSSGRRSRIEQIAYDRFDFHTMSRLVVARYWRDFTEQQQQEFIREFKEFLARTYGHRIDQYSNEKVEIVGQSPAPRGDVKVMTRIVGGQYEGAQVEYRLRQDDGHWSVIDVKVEGISLVLNYRDQFKALLARGGPEHLLEKLKEKNTEATS
jgi:phospholipid transport system substrate-binding protein